MDFYVFQSTGTPLICGDFNSRCGDLEAFIAGIENVIDFKTNYYGERLIEFLTNTRGARWLSGRVSDSGARGPGFETYRRRVVSLSKTLYSPKVLVNYPGSDGSVPI